MKISDIGPPDSKIMLIGEAPGEQEERQGIPFVGQSGTLLKQMLAHSGIDFSTCYATNVCAIRPPGNNFQFFYEDSKRSRPTAILESAWFDLRKKVMDLKPNIVICLGAEPLRALTGLRGIMGNRGIVHKFNGIKVLATYHPSAVLREYNLHPICEIDFAKAKRESLSPDHSYKQPQLILRPTMNDVAAFMQMAHQAKYIAFDIETIERHVRCISFAYKGIDGLIRAISIPLIKFSNDTMASIGSSVISMLPVNGGANSYWSASNEVTILEMINSLFANENLKFVGQNSIHFDAPIIEKNFKISIANHWLDIMHAWHLLYAELPKGLDFISSVLTDYPAYWNKLDTSDDNSEWEYNALDSACTLECAFKIEAELISTGQEKVYREITHPLALALTRMSNRGVLVDVKVREEMKVACEQEIARLQNEVNLLIKKPINLNSPTQLKALIYDELRFPQVKNKNDTVSVDEDCLRRLERAYPDEKLFDLIIRYRKEQKLISSFLQTAIATDGRMHTSYNASGTESSRISSSSDIHGEGMNLQNIPAGRGRGIKNLKNVFIAPKGCKLVKADLSQAEARVVAELIYKAGDATLYNKFREPTFDIHKWAASCIYKCPEEQVDKKKRDVGKLYNHSGNYGAGPRVLLTKAVKEGNDEIDYKTSQMILDTMRSGPMKGLRLWWVSVENKLKRTRTLDTCFGRRRMFFGRLDESTFRDAYAWEPQSTVGDICNKMVVYLDNNLEEDCKLILAVHDEVVVECPEEKVDYVVKQIERAAFVPLFINEQPLIIPVEISVGDNWRDCKAYGNKTNG